tara:strand:+ start:774 stop:1022 length:249 start_codon:yes stop_codon:yes gene_type:complete
MKKNCVPKRNINGNISKIIEGELISERYTGTSALTLALLRNSVSLSMFSINTRLSIIIKTLNKDFKYDVVKNFIYVFIVNII